MAGLAKVGSWRSAVTRTGVGPNHDWLADAFVPFVISFPDTRRTGPGPLQLTHPANPVLLLRVRLLSRHNEIFSRFPPVIKKRLEFF